MLDVQRCLAEGVASVTILQALDRYYDRMAARNEAEAPGYSREKISFAIALSATGEPIQKLDLRDRTAANAWSRAYSRCRRR